MMHITRAMRWPAVEVIRIALSRDLRAIGRVLTKKWFIFIACLWAVQASAQGTYTAASCSEVAVLAAVTAEQAHAVDGDIISIPAGSCAWTTQLTATFNNSVTIQGAGAISATTGGASTSGSDLTSITDDVGGDLQINTMSGKSVRITGIADIGSSSAGNGSWQILGTSSAVRVDHCHIVVTSASSVGLYIGGSVTGVADHDYFDSGAGGFIDNPIAVHNGNGWNGTSSADNSFHSWAYPDNFGSSQFFFFEDDLWSQADIGDSHDGARYVIRHSTYTGSHGQMYNHGITDAAVFPMKAVEIYLNNFDTSPSNSAPAFSNNGGALLFWGNTSTGHQYMTQFAYTRVNNGTYNYGTVPNGWGNCAGGGAYTAWDYGSNGPCMAQPGLGPGDLLSGTSFPNIVNSTTGTQSWPHQTLDPIYVWANTFNDAGYSPEGYLQNSITALLADNKNYYQQFNSSYGEPGNFNGTAGVGQGSSLPSTAQPTCTPGSTALPSGTIWLGVSVSGNWGPGYWDTSNNTLYICTSTNTWTAYYTPYTYPNPLTQSSTGTTVAAPTNLSAIVQ